MLKKLVTSALFAGFGAGLIAAFLQLTLLVPILLEAEEYEHGNKVHFEAFMTEETVEPVAEAEGLYAEPSAWSRNSQTILWTTGIYVGFALMMVAGFGIAERFGHSVTARTGIIWGIGGFVALQFAPSAGLPPELPGAWAADLAARQYWQIFAILATLAGLVGIGFGKNWLAWGVGILLIATPHILGAPHPTEFGGVVPPELSAHFASLSLSVGAIGWSFLGLFAGYLWAKQTPT